MSDFVQVAAVSEVPNPGKLTVECNEELVVVFQVEGQYYCIDDICTHDGGPLGEGALDGCTIACPRHGAKFDIRDGKALTMPATSATRSHEVKVEDGQIFVKLCD